MINSSEDLDRIYSVIGERASRPEINPEEIDDYMRSSEKEHDARQDARHTQKRIAKKKKLMKRSDNKRYKKSRQREIDRLQKKKSDYASDAAGEQEKQLGYTE